MSTLAAATQLATEASEVLAGVEGVGSYSTTLDPRTIPPTVAGGDLAVVVNPPTRTFTTWHEQEWEWEVWVVAGPANDLPTAWGRLDAAVDALAGPLEVATARPDAFSAPDRAQYPAYVLTIPSNYHTS